MKVALLIVAVVLVVVNMIGSIMASSGFPDRGAMIVQLVLYAILAPSVFAGIYLIPKANRTFRHFLTAFCLISFLVGASNFFAIVRDATAQTRANTVRGTDSAVEITIPADWRTSERKKAHHSIYVVDKLAVRAVLVVSLKRSETEWTFDQFVTAMLEQQREAQKLVSLTGIQPCPVPKVKCVAYELRQEVGDTTTVQIMSFVEGVRDYHAVTAATNLPLFDESKQKLIEIIASFKDRS